MGYQNLICVIKSKKCAPVEYSWAAKRQAPRVLCHDAQNPKPHHPHISISQKVRQSSILGPPSAKRQGCFAMTLQIQKTHHPHISILPSDVTLLLLLFIINISYQNILKKINIVKRYWQTRDKEKRRFWNLRVMAKDPWRLALGGPRILARRIFCGVCRCMSSAIYLRDKLVLESEHHGKGPLALGAWRSKNTV